METLAIDSRPLPARRPAHSDDPGAGAQFADLISALMAPRANPPPAKVANEPAEPGIEAPRASAERGPRHSGDEPRQAEGARPDTRNAGPAPRADDPSTDHDNASATADATATTDPAPAQTNSSMPSPVGPIGISGLTAPGLPITGANTIPSFMPAASTAAVSAAGAVPLAVPATGMPAVAGGPDSAPAVALKDSPITPPTVAAPRADVTESTRTSALSRPIDGAWVASVQKSALQATAQTAAPAGPATAAPAAADAMPDASPGTAEAMLASPDAKPGAPEAKLAASDQAITAVPVPRNEASANPAATDDPTAMLRTADGAPNSPSQAPIHAQTASALGSLRQADQTSRSIPTVDQVAIQIRHAAATGMDKIRIQLWPENLGRVEVRLEIDAAGTVKATILSDRPETLDLLQRDARSLDRALQDSGLKTDSNSLQFSSQDRSDRGQQRDANGTTSGPAHARGDEPIADLGNDPAPIVLRLNRTGLLDIQV